MGEKADGLKAEGDTGGRAQLPEWIIGEKPHSDSHPRLPVHSSLATVCPCLISVGDPDTADRMAQRSGWMGRQLRFHFPEKAQHSF